GNHVMSLRIKIPLRNVQYRSDITLILTPEKVKRNVWITEGGRDGRAAGDLDAGGNFCRPGRDAWRPRHSRRSIQRSGREQCVEERPAALGHRHRRAPARLRAQSGNDGQGRRLMTMQLALWIVLGGLALTIAGLFVTILARGMEKREAKA